MAIVNLSQWCGLVDNIISRDVEVMGLVAHVIQ